MTTHGLTLGKYAPLHRGHQHVIETAMSETDTITVMIYDAPETTIPLTVRAGWLRTLYPQINVIEAWDGPTAVGNTPEIRQRHEDYILKALGSQKITHFYSSEFYGDHMSRALGAVNRQVDPERQRYPVSGTVIRENAYAHRHHIDPLVYRDLIVKAVFLGAPSTGKTTLAAELAKVYDTVWMPEYGREYWEKHQIERRLTPEQLVDLAEGHLQREQRRLLLANRYLFVDTNAITTYMFAQSYHGFALPRLRQLATEAASRYDLVFVCDTDIPYDDTWDRSGDVSRGIFQKQIIADLHMRRIPYITLHGDLAARIATVQEVLSRYQKFTNLLDYFELK
jgi:HTH-type transcriptional repressor of NAD biosynthesis genes